MAAKICFITAVLAATAFDLAASCETCQEDTDIGPVEVDITFITFLAYPPEKVCEWVKTCTDACAPLQEYLDLFEAWKLSPEENRPALEEVLIKFYKSNPEEIKIHFELVFEYCATGTPADTSTCDVPIQYCPNQNDVFNWYETCCSHEPVQAFFDGKGMTEVAAAYKAWKAARDDEKLKAAYKAALYRWYQADPALLECDCPEFKDACTKFCTNPKCEVCASGSIPKVTNLVPQIVSEPALPVNPAGGY